MLEASLRASRTSSLVTHVNSLVGEGGWGYGTGFVLDFLLGNQEWVRSVALSFDSDIQMGNLGSERGSLRVGTVVFLTPWYHRLSRHRSVPGLTVDAKCRACDRFARATW